MKHLRINSSLRRSILGVKRTAALALMLPCLTSGLPLPGYVLTLHASIKAVAAPKTSELNTARYLHTATLLENGKVLLAGGAVGLSCPSCCTCPDQNSKCTSSAEIYDPAAGTWTNTGSLQTARLSHAATLLENGQVLITGGYAHFFGQLPLSGAELYDPATGEWRPTGSFNTIQGTHSTTLLASGRVLAVGHSKDRAPYVAELYDPATETWSDTDPPNIRSDSIASSILLQNGKVLAVSANSAELYDPETGSWSSAGNPKIDSANTATLLGNGKVLVIRYAKGVFNGAFLRAELYDPDTGEWSIAGSPTAGRIGGWETADYTANYTTSLLPNGQVLVAGGYFGDPGPKGEELYDPATETWRYSRRLLPFARHYHTATALADGSVVIAGGVDLGADQTSFPNGLVELYAPVIDPSVNPEITSASVSGKKLFVFGEKFDPGAVILLNGKEKPTKNHTANPNSRLIANKAGKRIKPGDKLQVRNPDGTMSVEFTFTSS